MLSKFLVALLFIGSLARASSVSCTVDAVVQSSSTSCLVNSADNTGFALGRLLNSIAGNVFTLSDISVAKHPSTAGVVAVSINDFVPVPAASPNDNYLVSLTIGASGSSSVAVQLGLAGTFGKDPACNLTPGCVYNLSLAASQIPSIIVQTSLTNLVVSSSMNTYANLSISQFGQDGRPDPFTTAPEPASLGCFATSVLLWTGFLFHRTRSVRLSRRLRVE